MMTKNDSIRSSAPSAVTPLRFEQRLVLYQWMLSLFGVSSFDRLAANLKAPELEGFDENNVTRFYHVLRLRDRGSIRWGGGGTERRGDRKGQVARSPCRAFRFTGRAVAILKRRDDQDPKGT